MRQVCAGPHTGGGYPSHSLEEQDRAGIIGMDWSSHGLIGLLPPWLWVWYLGEGIALFSRLLESLDDVYYHLRVRLSCLAISCFCSPRSSISYITLYARTNLISSCHILGIHLIPRIAIISIINIRYPDYFCCGRDYSTPSLTSTYSQVHESKPGEVNIFERTSLVKQLRERKVVRWPDLDSKCASSPGLYFRSSFCVKGRSQDDHLPNIQSFS